MAKDSELVNELKNGNSKRSDFFKDKIKEELKKENIEINDTIINDIFNKALDTYTEDIKIPFLFHIKATIKKILFPKEDINTGIFTKYEYKIISLYLKKEDNKYLSKEEIITKHKCSVDEFLKIIDKLNTSESSEVIKLFPNYEDIIKDRENYFLIKSSTLSDNQLSMLEYYTGALNNKPMSIKDLAIKFNIDRRTITNELVKIFRILQQDNNLEDFLIKYPNTKEIIIKKARFLRISLVIDDEIVNEDVINKKTETLNENNIKVLNILIKTNGMLISDEEAKKEGFKNIFDFVKQRDNLYIKLKNNYKLLEKTRKMFPNCNIKEFLTRPSLTKREIGILIFLKNTENEILTEDELMIIGRFKSIKAYRMGINKLYARLEKNNVLIEEAKLFYKNINLKNKPVSLSTEDIKLINLLNEHQGLDSKKLSSIGGYKNEFAFNNKKHQVLKKIESNKELEKKIKDKYPNVKIKHNRKKEKLTKNNIAMINLLEQHKNNPLSSTEMANKLGILNANSYNTLKFTLFKQLKSNETLKREALRLFPEFVIDDTINDLTIKYTKNEIIFLQEFCLVKNNDLVYQSDDVICKNLNLQPEMFEFVKKTSTAKVVKNMILGNDSDLILWTNFTYEFIARDNFKEKNSIKITENDLEYINMHKKRDNILNALIALNNSIFRDFVKECSDEEKLILAFRLGYFNNRFFTTEEVANIFNINEDDIIILTKECLKMSRNNYINEKKQKILI